jgi:imidazolonepropionase-like amidohydrolase
MADDPRLAFCPSELRNWFKNMGERLIDDEVVAGLRRICSGSRELVGAMNRAGVKILAGTDSGSVPFVLQGFSLHDELQLLVESGLSPLEALQTATKNASECMGRRDSLGTVEEGKIADLILLKGNPLTSIANTRKIDSVFFNGRYFDRLKLDTILITLQKLATEM